ncbi:hypothetical protein LK537_16315 [Lachnoclostridium pacaense]|uniref:hypothetical protein n=1 Tax=Enterocloster hominis (ex Hitch et al. 2024) TaxID=1917870 RepID=UPI001D121BDC|nr:hypothetical protein [Lachnoclostridium pacaense]MCC2818865.1 hypothetical protein [Lachnoclostridium pacaense]
MLKRILIIVALLICLIVGVFAVSKCNITPTESESTTTQEESSTEDLNIQLTPIDEPLKGYIVGEDGKLHEKETVSIETQSFQEQMETLEAGDLIEKARANQESLKESEEESRAEIGETQSKQEIADSEVLSDEEMIKLHEEFQSEIDSFNMKQYERMMAEWESKKGAE